MNHKGWSRSPLIIPLIVGGAQFMHQFDGAVIATALPSMAASLHEDPVRLNLAITTYLLALAVFVPVSGWMADRFGARRVFMAAIVVFTASSVLCGLAHSLVELVLCRVLQGMGGAMMTPVGRVIVLRSVPKLQLVQAMNYITIPAVLGPLLGPSVGGFIVTYFSWPWIFFINLPIGLVGIFMVRSFIPDVKAEAVTRLDLRGFALIGMAVAGLVFGFEAIGRGVVPSTVILASIAAGAVCTGFYLIHARRTTEAIIDLSLLRIRTFAASITGGGLFYLGTTSSVFLLALLLQLGFGFSAFQAGLMTLASAVGSLATRFAFRSLLRPLGFRRLLICNAIVTGAFLIGCGFFRITTPYLIIVAVLLIGGFSRSLQFTAVQSLAYAEMPSALFSRATSFLAMAQQLAQSFGVGLVALAVHLSLLWHARAAMTPQDIAAGYFTVGFLALVSVAVFYRLHAEAGAELNDR
ncbi:MAG TPA: MFS transporter [Xanthobacteraceae bacterium]|jgi:EmrB/QacA subfamily drug resistance transporter